MKTETVLITPLLAREMLLRVSPEKQRKLIPTTVQNYAKSMSLGHWLLTHQGIAFDDSGNLSDGQHRLNAVVESGVSVMMQVTRDVPEKQGDLFTFDAVDRGKIRGIGQQLQVRHGIKDANRTAAAARCIAVICTRKSVKGTVASIMAIIDRFGESIEFTNRHMLLSTMKTAGVIGSLAFCHRALPSQLNEFIKRVGDGDGISKGMPAFALRNLLLVRESPNGPLGGYERQCSLCAMHHILGNRVSQIKTSMAGIDFFADKQPRIVDEIASLF